MEVFREMLVVIVYDGYSNIDLMSIIHLLQFAENFS